MRFLLVLPLIAALAVATVGCGQSAKYPEKSITMVIPFPAGGSTDVFGRTLVEKLKAPLGQPVVVVNRTGGVQIGVTEVMQSKPDGYNIGLVNDIYLTVSPHITEVPYKGPGDMATFAMVYHAPMVLAVSPDGPWKTTKDFLEAGKASPGKIRVAGSAIGGVNHIVFTELSYAANSQFSYVPFAGGAQSLPAFLGGNAEAVVITPTEIKPYVDSGKARILGVFAEKRSAFMPEAPTMKEQGHNITREIVGVIFGPKALPDNIKATLLDAIKKVTGDPAFAPEVMKTTGFEVAFVGPEETTRRLADDYEKAKPLVDRLGLKQK